MAIFNEQTGSNNPFNGTNNTGTNFAPALADLDNDGDLDLIVGRDLTPLQYYQNTGSATNPSYVLQTGNANPFLTTLTTFGDIPYFEKPTFADIDGDGDPDAIVGAAVTPSGSVEKIDRLLYYQNTGSATAPSYVSLTGSANPFNGIDAGENSSPALADIDNDGDFDAIVGESSGKLRYFQNAGSSTNPSYVEQTGSSNPFDSIDVGGIVIGDREFEGDSTPTFVDIDGDGDLDLFVGEGFGTLKYYQNTGSTNSPSYVEQTGSNNPFNGIDVGNDSVPTFADVDGDGDLDAVVGERFGALRYFRNDTPPPNLSIGDVTVNEADGTATFTVALDAASGREITVNFATADGTATAGSDYTSASGTLTFAPGDTTKSITVNISEDSLDEVDETFTASLSNAANAVITDGNATATITDNDEPPSLSIGDVTVNEADGTATFTVALDAASNREIAVDFATANDTAIAGSDYTSNSGTLTFAPGDTTKAITVNISEDNLDEVDETFTVGLSNAANAIITDGKATAIITDNDEPPNLSIDDVTINEADGTATFTVTLDAASGKESTVDFVTADGTAIAGSDYEATNGTLTFAPGETEQTISVNIQEDNVYEPSQNFFVRLENSVNAEIGASQNQGEGVILDDDLLPKLRAAVPKVNISEGDRGKSTAKFVLTLKGRTELETVVDYRTVNGEAKAGSDYTKTSGQVTLRPGQVKKTIRVPIIGDTQVEADETFKLEIVNASNAQLVKNTTTVTIRNDDDRARSKTQRADSLIGTRAAIASEPDQLMAPSTMKVFEPSLVKPPFEIGSTRSAQLSSSAIDNSSLFGVAPLLSMASRQEDSGLITVSEALI